MIPLATIFAAARKWWKLAVGIILGALLIFPLAQCSGKRIGRQEMQSAIDRANVQALREKARADELAAQQRLTDTIAVSRQEEDLRDAIASTPDSAPDATRIALGCQRLRAAGTDTSRIPACAGLGR